MAEVDFPPLQIPQRFLDDPETQDFFTRLITYTRQAYTRLGGASDIVASSYSRPDIATNEKPKSHPAPVYEKPRISSSVQTVMEAVQSLDDRVSVIQAESQDHGMKLRDYSIPSGVILAWSGSTATIPRGWYICDGSNGTPDLRDRFIVGAGSTYAVDDTGGAVDDTLNITTDTTALTTSAPNDTVEVQSGTGATVASQTHTHTINAHNHTDTFTVDTLPPYYALAWIMKA